MFRITQKFKIKAKYTKNALKLGSLRHWPYIKKSPKRNNLSKNIP